MGWSISKLPLKLEELKSLRYAMWIPIIWQKAQMSLKSFRAASQRHSNTYGELLDMKGLEAVFIGTIPHWHALQFIAACKKGLDIYCEKPLAYDIMEGLAMVNAAKKAGNIVQVGFQRRQAESFKKAKELIESGRIGEVHQIVAQIHYNPGHRIQRFNRRLLHSTGKNGAVRLRNSITVQVSVTNHGDLKRNMAMVILSTGEYIISI